VRLQSGARGAALSSPPVVRVPCSAPRRRRRRSAGGAQACAGPWARAGGCTAPADQPAGARAAGDSAATRCAAAGGAPPPAGPAAGARAAEGGARAGGGAAGGGLLGLAVATCCHHRCMWRDYVGKRSSSAPDSRQKSSKLFPGCAAGTRPSSTGRPPGDMALLRVFCQGRHDSLCVGQAAIRPPVEAA